MIKTALRNEMPFFLFNDVDIKLVVRDRDIVLVELFLDLLHHVKVNIPVILGVHPDFCRDHDSTFAVAQHPH